MDQRCDLLCLDLEKAEALRLERIDRTRIERCARQARALSDPTRLSLISVLVNGGELCVCDLAWILERAENLVSHHLRLLRAEELVASRRAGKMVMYSVTDRGRALLDATLAEELPV